MKPVYIEVSAGVQYWEDATVNGNDDLCGTLIPFRTGDLWCPTIRLADGMVMDWPAGVTADVHYKVCDQGQYWLLDGSLKRIAKWSGAYVPDRFLCPGSGGYGDYIIFRVGVDGRIIGWRQPDVEDDEWNQPSWPAMVLEKMDELNPARADSPSYDAGRAWAQLRAWAESEAAQ